MRNRFLSNIKTFITKNEDKISATAMVATCVATSLITSNTACAAGASADDIANLVTKILGGGATIIGAIRLLTGCVSYANAQDDQSGPDMKKAEGKIAAGVIVGAVGLLIFGMSSQIAGWMNLS